VTDIEPLENLTFQQLQLYFYFFCGPAHC